MSKIPIEAVLLIKYNMTLRDLKSEALLAFVHLLLDDFTNGYADQKGIACKTQCTKQADYIYEQSLIIKEYLGKNLLETFGSMQSKMNNATLSEAHFSSAKIIEPLAYYFDVLAKNQKNLLPTNSSWLPEVISYSLIILWLDEKEKNFKKHPFLNKINFSAIMENIYQIHKASKDNEDEFLKTLIRKMMDVSELMIEKLNNSKFKITTSSSKKKRKR